MNEYCYNYLQIYFCIVTFVILACASVYCVFTVFRAAIGAK